MTGILHQPLAAGIVVYRPEPGLAEALVQLLLPQVDQLLVYCNSPLPVALSATLTEHRHRLAALGDGRNLGLGVAHNRIIEAAIAQGIKHVLLLDQDSIPPPGLGRELLARMSGLITAGHRPAVVGARPVGSGGSPYKAPRLLPPAAARPHGCDMPVELVISSGSLIDASAYHAIGPFREDFFIDAIDTEWCLRARFMGFTCWMATDLAMEHRLGAGVLRLPLGGVQLVRQPPSRAYTFVRNQLAMFRLQHVPSRWKLRAVARLAAYSIGQTAAGPNRGAVVRALARGWRDGLLGRLGQP
jgi:rhamnosyltransferase